jgi:YidC/Oxa1 family membrane protein insertase
MQQKRLLIASAISLAILIVWSYFLPVKPPQPNQPAATATPEPAATSTPSAESTPATTATPTNDVGGTAQFPERSFVVKTPLYEATFESRGGEPVSWIIKRNKESQSEIYSVASTKSAKVPLQLISQVGLTRQPREVPLQLLTGDSAVDGLLSSVSYRVDGLEGSASSHELVLSGEERKRVVFSYQDAGSGLDISKAITFQANRYEVDLEVSLKRAGQPLPQTRVRVGPSIGDQGVKHYSFYSVAPEAVAAVGETAERHSAQSINENKNSPDALRLNGPVQWAGIGDTYFAMVLVPAHPAEAVEYRTVQYDYNGKKEKRYLISAFVPIATDGSRNVVYTGPKDHYLLTDASAYVAGVVGRPADLEALIDYGWFRWLSRPLAVPILNAIRWLKDVTHNYGIAIILFTIVIYSLFFPLKWRSSKAMKKAQKLAPRMKDLQEKIKGLKQNDPRLKELQMEQLRLMKEGNPLGGCLPLLIQMPFLFALYRAITISLDFRQATFLWLPDLSAGDPFHILEILMAATMIVLQLITPAPSADPLQRKMMAIGMPIFMLYVLWGAPSGLLLYWLVGNIVGFSQQFLINHLTKSGDDDANVQPPEANTRSKKKSPRAAAAT